MKKHDPEHTDDSLQAMLERAKAGDRISAKQALAWMADALATTAPVPETIRMFLAEALWNIAHKNADANEALRLKVSHRAPEHDYVDLRHAAVRMRCLMECEDDNTKRRFTKKEAAKKAAADYNKSQEKYYAPASEQRPQLTQSAVETFYDAHAAEIDSEAQKCRGVDVAHKI